MRRWHCHEHKAATKHLLHHVHTHTHTHTFYAKHHQTTFTPDTSYTKRLLHQAPLTPNTFYTTHRLPQTPLKLSTFYPQKHLHQKPFTPHTLHTRPLLHKISFEHQTTSFLITHLLHQTTTYYNVLLRTTTYSVVLQPATKYSDALQRQNKYYSTLLYSTLHFTISAKNSFGQDQDPRSGTRQFFGSGRSPFPWGLEWIRMDLVSTAVPISGRNRKH